MRGVRVCDPIAWRDVWGSDGVGPRRASRQDV